MEDFETQELFNHRSLKSLDGRATGDSCIFVVSRAAKEEDRYESVVWKLQPQRGGEPRMLTSDSFDAKSPKLDPTGGRIAFLSRRGGKRPQIQLLSLEGGEARQLGEADADVQSIQAWSADAERLLVLVSVAWPEDEQDDPDAESRPYVVAHLPYKRDGSGAIVGFRTQLWQVDVRDGKMTPLVQGDFDVDEAQWSPDGRRLAYVRRRGGRQRHRCDLWIAEADGSDARQVTQYLATVSGLSWSPDGTLLAFGGSRTEGDSLNHLWLYRPGDEQPYRPGDNKLHLEGSRLLWHADGDRLATIEARRGLHGIAVVDVRSGRIEHLESGLRQITAVCGCGDRIAYVAASMRRCEEVRSMRWDGTEDRRHTGFNRRWQRKKALPRVSKRRFDVPDGNGGTERIDAWLLRPPGHGPFPTLLDFHGGPQSVALMDFASHTYWYTLVSKGWMVVAPNAVGSGSYGEEFAERLRGRWGELDLPQHLAILDALQQEGIADERLACTGKSYGGFLAAWALGHTDRFVAVVVSAPVANIESHAGTSDTGYYVTPYAMDGEITDARQRCHLLSPIEYCHSTSAATLLLQGEKDERCPLGQSEELFAHLIRCSNAAAKMVVYPGGSHALASNGKPSHRLDYHSRIVAWLEHWVAGTGASR